MTNKKLILITLALLTMLFSGFTVYAELTQGELQSMLGNQDELNSLKDNINEAFDNFPSVIKDTVFGGDRIYHVQIGDSNLEVVFENERITMISPGIPDSPTHVLNMSHDTVLKIANSENPITTAVQTIVRGEIKIKNLQSNFIFTSNPLLMWIIGIVAGIIIFIVGIILLIVKLAKRKKKAGIDGVISYCPDKI